MSYKMDHLPKQQVVASEGCAVTGVSGPPCGILILSFDYTRRGEPCLDGGA
jgi:hypothetical protein